MICIQKRRGLYVNQMHFASEVSLTEALAKDTFQGETSTFLREADV